ncbi:MAG: hypothetical protein WEB60_11220 [Terrimicrobiaceae bacterium]
MVTTNILPDLQAAILCEDVRQEINGSQTLVGVINVIPAPVVPIGLFKLCLWSRWCGGTGEFEQESLVMSCDDDAPIAKASVRFRLPALDAHATNVHVFGGIQFPKHGLYHIEIRIDDQIRLRFPLAVVAVQNQLPGTA